MTVVVNSEEFKEMFPKVKTVPDTFLDEETNTTYLIDNEDWEELYLEDK